jgi:hypothetical protein
MPFLFPSSTNFLLYGSMHILFCLLGYTIQHFSATLFCDLAIIMNSGKDDFCIRLSLLLWSGEKTAA